MCGRFTLRTPAQEIASLFDVMVPDLEPRYNIAPSQNVAAVRIDGDRQPRELAWLRWGLIPVWSDEPKTSYSTINARAESVATKPTYRRSFQNRRCLIVADGFYEWKKTEPKKQPFYIHLKNHRPFAFAGLWERWERDDRKIDSCSIIVTRPNTLVAGIHDRMPVILSPVDYDRWLDPSFQDKHELQELLRPYPAEEMGAYPVRTIVNSPKNDVAQCIKPSETSPDRLGLFSDDS